MAEEPSVIEDIGVIVIHVSGSVKTEGIVKLEEGSRIIDAIEASGGLLEDADLTNVNLAYVLEDGQKLYIPSINDETIENSISTGNGDNIISGSSSSSSSSSGGKVNINTATQQELQTLPGIGAATALKIIEYRESNGKFSSVEDIKNVNGIGDAKYEGIKDYICIK